MDLPQHFESSLQRVAERLPQQVARRMVIDGGDEAYARHGVEVVGIG